MSGTHGDAPHSANCFLDCGLVKHPGAKVLLDGLELLLQVRASTYMSVRGRCPSILQLCRQVVTNMA